MREPMSGVVISLSVAEQVEELSEFSARHHAGDPSRTRCFSRVMFCALHNGQSPREVRDITIYDSPNGNLAHSFAVF